MNVSKHREQDTLSASQNAFELPTFDVVISLMAPTNARLRGTVQDFCGLPTQGSSELFSCLHL